MIRIISDNDEKVACILAAIVEENDQQIEQCHKEWDELLRRARRLNLELDLSSTRSCALREAVENECSEWRIRAEEELDRRHRVIDCVKCHTSIEKAAGSLQHCEACDHSWHDGQTFRPSESEDDEDEVHVLTDDEELVKQTIESTIATVRVFSGRKRSCAAGNSAAILQPGILQLAILQPAILQPARSRQRWTRRSSRRSVESAKNPCERWPRMTTMTTTTKSA